MITEQLGNLFNNIVYIIYIIYKTTLKFRDSYESYFLYYFLNKCIIYLLIYKWPPLVYDK